MRLGRVLETAGSMGQEGAGIQSRKLEQQVTSSPGARWSLCEWQTEAKLRGQQEEGQAGVPRMLAGVPLSKCWEPFPRDSLSSPDLGLLGRGRVQVRAALHPPATPIRSHRLPSPPPPAEHLGTNDCKARCSQISVSRGGS